MTTMPIDFKPPWVGVTPTERQQLEAELAQEVCLLHPLASLDREVVARRTDTDDILVAINPHLCECAQVHLTWSGKTEMNPEVPSGTAGNFPRLGAGEDASGSQGLHRQSTRMNGANEIFSLDPGLLFSSMSGSQPQVPSKFALGLFFLTGAYSLAVPLVITPIALFRLSGAIHGHPIFGWVLCFYLSSLMPGAVSLITVCRTRWFIMLWLPLAGITLNGALGFLALCFWVLSGMNIQ